MSQPITLDIFSDPICPWCYIGLKRLDTALEELEETVVTKWRCYMLNPDMPPEGMDRRTYLERKFGGPAGADRVYGAIETTARQAGIDVNFAAIMRTPSTYAAHQALRGAQELGQGDAFIRKLFAAYFEQGKDIGDQDVLTDLWVTCDMLHQELTALLDDQRHLATIISEMQEARHRGVNGVPFFVLGGTYALSGAQDKAAFAHVFNLLRDKRP